MKKSPLRISAVSYVNTLPFVYGIEKSGHLKNFSLSLDTPSVCADKLLKGKTDVGLAPVAVIPLLKKSYILPGYCIGADGPVRSVMLYSEVPLHRIKTIYLDYQSRTSVLLVKVLARYGWVITPRFAPTRAGYEKKIKGTSAGVIIGDRNFIMKKKYPYRYDLAGEWKRLTGLPFVFACWIFLRQPDKITIRSFSNALRYGIRNRNKAAGLAGRQYNSAAVKRYLSRSISYRLDDRKKLSMDLFLNLARILESGTPGKKNDFGF